MVATCENLQPCLISVLGIHREKIKAKKKKKEKVLSKSKYRQTTHHTPPVQHSTPNLYAQKIKSKK